MMIVKLLQRYHRLEKPADPLDAPHEFVSHEIGETLIVDNETGAQMIAQKMAEAVDVLPAPPTQPAQ